MIPLRDDNPTRITPYVTAGIIAANVAVFILQASLGEGGAGLFIHRTAAIPYEITRSTDIYPPGLLPPPFTLLTSLFVHGGLLHLAGNMLYLWIFGDNIEERLGRAGFVLFYLASGVAASLAHIALHPDSTMPLVGASGAIAGVLGAYFVLYPRAHVVTLLVLPLFVQVVKLPAVLFLGIWFLFQLASSAGGGNIAWYAHIGGFVVGAAAGGLLAIPYGRRKR